MEGPEDEESQLRLAALKNAQVVRDAWQRANLELLKAKEELETTTRELAYALSTTRATLEATTDGILVTDAAGHLTDCNERFLSMWRISRDQLEKKTHHDLQANFSRLLKGADAYLARNAQIYSEWPLETSDVLEFIDGRVFERNSKIQRVKDRAVGRVWSYADISEHVRAEKALHDQSEWFRVTLGSIGDAVITVDTRSRITFLNPIAERYTGWLTSDAMGMAVSEVLNIVNETTRAPALNPIDRALSHGEIVGLANHTILIGRNGSELPIEDSAAPIKDISGKIIGAVMVFHDVSERREKERALAQLYDRELKARDAAEKANKAKDDFLANLSHELRTPLTPVLAILSEMIGDPQLPEKLSGDLQMMRRNVELEARLIDDLLDLTRIGRGKLELTLEHLQISTLIDDVLSICAPDIKAKSLSLTRDIEASHETVFVDRIRITQVLWNLLKNSVKFTPDRGAIAVRVRTEGKNADRRVLIEVKDSGMGIESQRQETLFNAFEQGGREVTRQFGGLGLGLAISKGIAESHGGTITVFSAGLGQGSTFTLILPMAVRSANDPGKPSPTRSGNSASSSPGALRRRNLRILLVEDHADTAAILSRILSKIGHTVIHSPTIAGAMSTMESQQAGNGIELVISDVGLPDGSGLTMMRVFSKKYAVTGIALSGFGMESDIEESLAAGFSRHLTKPIDVSFLRKTIDELTSEP
jgi:PAS domain S-box-containing protein